MKYRRKRRNQTTAELERLKRELQAEGPFKDQKIVFQSSPEKMSEVLLEFIEPYQQYADTSQAMEKLIALAIVAWNVALLEGTERQELLDSSVAAILEAAGEESKDDLLDILDAMIRRKDRFFADNKRFILHYHLSEDKQGFHLSVASTAGEAST